MWWILGAIYLALGWVLVQMLYDDPDVEPQEEKIFTALHILLVWPVAVGFIAAWWLIDNWPRHRMNWVRWVLFPSYRRRQHPAERARAALKARREES